MKCFALKLDLPCLNWQIQTYHLSSTGLETLSIFYFKIKAGLFQWWAHLFAFLSSSTLFPDINSWRKSYFLATYYCPLFFPFEFRASHTKIGLISSFTWQRIQKLQAESPRLLWSSCPGPRKCPLQCLYSDFLCYRKCGTLFCWSKGSRAIRSARPTFKWAFLRPL